ncbi:hypothetical protein AAG906_010935 [Vitis piasezkii]
MNGQVQGAKKALPASHEIRRPTDLVYNCNWESENRARIVNENCWFTQQESSLGK